MQIVLNGKPREVPDDASTVRRLVEHLGFTAGSVVVERNGEAIARADFDTQPVEPGDTVEVIRPVQGGAGEAREAVDRARIYLVCDGAFGPLADVISAGVGVVQLREKDAEAMAVIEAAGPILEACRRAGVPFVVNDRPDIARTLGAEGVHLGQDDLPPAAAREICGPDVIIGRSTHAPAQIEAAIAEHERGLVDYIAVGPVYATPTKPGRLPVGTDLLRYASERVDFPWFAIGGINADSIDEVAEAGAQRVVVVRAITEAPDPVAATKALLGGLE